MRVKEKPGRKSEFFLYRHFCCSSPNWLRELGIVTTILLVRKLKLKKLVQGHRASKPQSWKPKPVLISSSNIILCSYSFIDAFKNIYCSSATYRHWKYSIEYDKVLAPIELTFSCGKTYHKEVNNIIKTIADSDKHYEENIFLSMWVTSDLKAKWQDKLVMPRFEGRVREQIAKNPQSGLLYVHRDKKGQWGWGEVSKGKRTKKWGRRFGQGPGHTGPGAGILVCVWWEAIRRLESRE